ncbi:hypothetical protein BKN38_08620 [Helicobacter sp. CLO-3]|nr:hypothetical protein BA723_06635 [Helicobacter sp. CLO-3]OHU81637.1 hypothetical protein BKN38_08620 [Helicobacter sp. CLO-3]
MKLAFITKRGECVLDLSQIAPSVAGVASADSINHAAGAAGANSAQDLLEAQILQCARESGILSAKNLILFFGGFGSSPTMFSHLLAQNGDFGGDCSGDASKGFGEDFGKDFGVIMCYEYDDINMLCAPPSASNITLAGALESALACIFGAFGAREKSDSSGVLRADSQACKIDSCVLVGFSMGVCVGAKILAQSPSLTARISKAIAINGSNAGIHDTFGIKARIFARTAKHLDIKAFASALFGENLAESKKAESTPEPKNADSENIDSGAQIAKLAQKFRLDSDTSALKKELLCLQEFCASEQNLTFAYDVVIISRQDKIFPPQANSAFFAQTSTAIHYIDAPHFAFSHFKSWGEICAM